MRQTIFISYSWANTDIADIIDKSFESTGLSIKRDIREIGYKGSIKEYMKQVRSTDFVLLIISDAFLKSSNSMFEVLELLKEVTFKNKILPIVVDDLKIYKPEERIEYISYWSDKYNKLKKRLESVNITDAIEHYNELKHYENIRTSIDEFLKIISDLNSPKFSELRKDNFQKIFDYIGVSDRSLINGILALKDFETSEERDIEIDKLEAKFPNNSKIYFTKGYYAFLKEEISKSSYFYNRSIELDPSLGSSYFNLGFNIDFYGQDYEEAEKLYLKAIELEPTISKAYTNLSIIYSAKFNKPEKGNEFLFKALEVNPYDSVAHYNLAYNFQKYFDDFKKAKYHYEQAIAINEDFVDARHNYATLLWREFEQYADAKFQYEEALQIQPNNKNTLEQLASLLEIEYKHYTTAKTYYDRFIKIEPNTAKNHYDYAVFLMLHLRDSYSELANKHHDIALSMDSTLEFNDAEFLFEL